MNIRTKSIFNDAILVHAKVRDISADFRPGSHASRALEEMNEVRAGWLAFWENFARLEEVDASAAAAFKDWFDAAELLLQTVHCRYIVRKLRNLSERDIEHLNYRCERELMTFKRFHALLT